MGDGFRLNDSHFSEMYCERFLLALLSAIALTTTANSASGTFNQQLTYDSSSMQTFARGAEGNFGYETHYGAGWQQFVQFDSSLGTLDSIDWTVDIQWSVNSGYTYMPWFGTPGYGTANESFQMELFRIGGLSLDGKVFNKTSGLPSDSNALSVPASGGTGGLLMEGMFTHKTEEPDVLDDFANGFTMFMDTKSRYANSGNYASGAPSSPHLVVDLTYTFNYTPTAVPEPSTFALAAVGVMAFLGMRLRKRNR